MRDRSLLHVNQIEAFKAWAKEKGWKEEPTNGTYEVFRLRHPRSRHPAIYHRRATEPVHVTAWGVGLDLAKAFIDWKRIPGRLESLLDKQSEQPSDAKLPVRCGDEEESPRA